MHVQLIKFFVSVSDSRFMLNLLRLICSMDANGLFHNPRMEDSNTSNLELPELIENIGEDNIESKESKRKNVNPAPKLDVGRLLGPRGLPCLNKHFEQIEFRGAGHEAEDLNTLLSHLEHWAHRLYPKMMFKDCLEKIGKLGHKKEIHTCMKKIRMGMPLLNSSEGTTVITDDGPDEDDNELNRVVDDDNYQDNDL